MRKGRVPFLITMLAPPLLFYVVFVLSPYLQGVQISLTDWTGLTADFSYIGLENYKDLIGDNDWWSAVLNNAKLLLVLPLVTIGLALLIASLLTRGGTGGAKGQLFGAQAYRVMFFFPVVMPATIVAIMFSFIYKPTDGLLERVLSFFGIDMAEIVPAGLLGDSDTILWAVMFVSVWATVGFFMVLFIAGIQQIPRDLFEAAALEGAGRFRLFFSVTLPLLWNHVQVALVYIAVSTLDLFALIAVLAQNGKAADFGSDVMATQIFRTGINQADFGYASAMATMLLLFALIIALATFRLTRRERIEY